MKSFCKNCESLQPSSFRLEHDAVTRKPYEDLCCNTCHFVVATVQGREALAQPVQEPVAWAVYYKGGGSKSLHWPNQHSPDGDATMFDAVPLVPQRPWVGLTDEQREECTQSPFTEDNYEDIEDKLRELNT
jgi:hypothetical protein